MPGLVYAGSTHGASSFTEGCYGEDDRGADVWFSLTPPTAGPYFISLCGSEFDTTLAIYSGTCDNLVNIGCSDDYCNVQSARSADLDAGRTYLIRVDGYANAAGTYLLTVVPPPANDQCEDAIPLGLNERYIGSTFGAGTEVADCGGQADIWFTFTPPSTGSYTISLCGSSYDTVLSVHGGTCDRLITLICEDDFCYSQSQVTIELTAETTYYLRVAGYERTDTGAYHLLILPNTLPPFEGEGEPPSKGEGEVPVEGEPPSEGEGEVPVEGEPPSEGEGEGEAPAEGEGESPEPKEPECGLVNYLCSRDSNRSGHWRQQIGDFLLLGVTFLTLLGLSGYRKRW